MVGLAYRILKRISLKTHVSGALVHLRVLGRHILVVNDHVIAQDLLDSSIHADRPRFTMAGELYVYQLYS